MMKKILSFLFTLLLAMPLIAQTTEPVEMADVMRSNGKIYVVLAVVLVIFAGIIMYLVSLDRKITRMEKEQDKK